MATILVTGDTGFIGTALTQELVAFGHDVIGVSRQEDGVTNLSELENYTHLTADLSELSEDSFSHPVDAVIDLAWAGSTGAARGNEDLQAANVRNALRTVELAVNLKALVYVGVGTITELTALSEDALAGPATTYGLMKDRARQETKQLADELQIAHTWARLGNTYAEDDTSGRFLNSTLSKLARDEEVELLTGNQPFDFIYLQDAVRALRLIIETGVKDIYYVGNGDVSTIEDFVEVAATVLKSSSRVVSHQVDKIGLTPEQLKNTDLMALGYQPHVSFIEGVRRWSNFNQK